MVWTVTRAPSVSAATVVCYRCGGNHFAKNKKFPERNCKNSPVLAPPASDSLSVVQAMWSSFSRRVRQKLIESPSKDKEAQARAPAPQDRVKAAQESKLVEGLRAELAAKCVELKEKDQEIASLREKLVGVSASLDSVTAKLEAHGKQLAELVEKDKRASQRKCAETQTSVATADHSFQTDASDLENHCDHRSELKSYSPDPDRDVVERVEPLVTVVDPWKVSNEYGTISRECLDCEDGIVLTIKQQEIYYMCTGYSLPKRCKRCREARKEFWRDFH